MLYSPICLFTHPFLAPLGCSQTKEYKVAPDISSWEYLINLLCQCLCIHKALPIVGRLKGGNSNGIGVSSSSSSSSSSNGGGGGGEDTDYSLASGLAAIHTSIARAAVILGDLKVCRRSIVQAEEALVQDESFETAHGHGATPGQQPRATGGKKSWREEVDVTREESLQVLSLSISLVSAVHPRLHIHTYIYIQL